MGKSGRRRFGPVFPVSCAIIPYFEHCTDSCFQLCPVAFIAKYRTPLMSFGCFFVWAMVRDGTVSPIAFFFFRANRIRNFAGSPGFFVSPNDDVTAIIRVETDFQIVNSGDMLPFLIFSENHGFSHQRSFFVQGFLAFLAITVLGDRGRDKGSIKPHPQKGFLPPRMNFLECSYKLLLHKIWSSNGTKTNARATSTTTG